MLKEIQATIYDIFGYLMPGFVAFIGIAILFWSIFLPGNVLHVPQFVAELWIAITIAAYFFGHICQALANLIFHTSDASMRILSKGTVDALPSPLINTISQKISVITGMKPEELSPHLLYQLSDEFVAQYGKTTDRDIFVYREGFYRGSCIAFVILALSLTVRAFHPNAMLNFDGVAYQINTTMFIFLILMALISAYLSFRRYKRFGDYRVTQAFLGFFALLTKLIDEQKPTI